MKVVQDLSSYKTFIGSISLSIPGVELGDLKDLHV